MTAAQPGVTVTNRDLGHQEIPFVTEAFIGAMYTPAEARTPEQKSLLTLSDELIAELKAADVYVFGIPMYNFGVPAVFKAYIDYVARANETFNPGDLRRSAERTRKLLSSRRTAARATVPARSASPTTSLCRPCAAFWAS